MARSSNGRGNGTSPSNLYPPEGEPLDQDITTVIGCSETVDAALVLLRSELLLWAQRAYNGITFTGDCDDHIKQLVRVIGELKRTGQCFIKGKLIRPGSKY